MRGTAVPRAWAALEPHFPRASHSRLAHSSRGFGGVHTTRIPMQAAVLRISTYLWAAVPRISMRLEAAVPRISTQL